MAGGIVSLEMGFQVIEDVKLTSAEYRIHFKSTLQHHLLLGFVNCRVGFSHGLLVNLYYVVRLVRWIVHLVEHIHFSLILAVYFLLLVIYFGLYFTLNVSSFRISFCEFHGLIEVFSSVVNRVWISSYY